MCEEEKLLTSLQAKHRLEWVDEQLPLQPHSKDWEDVAFCDEFHFGIDPQNTKRIKWRRGNEHQYVPKNVHRKKITSKDTKAKAQEEKHLKLLSVFVVIRFNYRKIIPYNAGNSVGKMNTDCYIKDLLPQLLDDFKDLGLTLGQDVDSAHNSAATKAWAKKNGLPLITLPGLSLDFSIMESMAGELKKKFHARWCTTEKVALNQFTQIFDEEMDQEKIQEYYKWYTKRMHECRCANGQMTRY